jgi:STE24 endopeptidase
MGSIVADALNSEPMNAPFSPSLALTLVFALTLLFGLLLKFWLATRQIRHVASHRQAVPAAFGSAITLAAHQKAADYTIAKTRFGLLELAAGTVVLIGWTLLGGLNTLNQALASWLGSGMVQQLALIAAFVLIGGLIELPLSLYQTFVIEERFGFNKMTFKLWLLDLLKASLLGALIGLPIAALILWVMGATGTMWWIYAWFALAVFSLFLMWIAPVFIMPLFNKFTPLNDETLKARITDLMQRCGFAAKGLFVMDGSRRSAHANAFFTGFGANKRVVFFDTLLVQLSHAEMEAVLAHELGHFKHRHILKKLATSFSISLAGFALLGWLATQLWFYTGLGVNPNLIGPNDALALLLFVMVSPLFSFFIAPLLALFSRKHEFEADAYAVAQTSGTDLASALLKLYEDNASTLTPDPVYVKFYYSHPPASERLARLTP